MKNHSFCKEIKKLSTKELQILIENCVEKKVNTGDVKCVVSNIAYLEGQFDKSSIELKLIISRSENEWVNETE